MSLSFAKRLFLQASKGKRFLRCQQRRGHLADCKKRGASRACWRVPEWATATLQQRVVALLVVGQHRLRACKYFRGRADCINKAPKKGGPRPQRAQPGSAPPRPRTQAGKRMDGCPPHRSGLRAAPLYAPSFQGASRRGRHSREARKSLKRLPAFSVRSVFYVYWRLSFSSPLVRCPSAPGHFSKFDPKVLHLSRYYPRVL